MGNAVNPLAAGHPAAASEAVAGQAEVADAECFRVLHQDAKNDRMQMQMEVAVDMVEHEPGGAEAGKLGVDFGAQLRAQAVFEEVVQAGADRAVGEFARALTRPGICSGGRVEWPSSRVRCRPTPSRGFSRARLTASASRVRLPSGWRRSKCLRDARGGRRR